MNKENSKPHHYGHRQRLKDRFQGLTLESAFPSDYEKLEFALIFALPRQDTKPIAKELIDAFGSLKQVLDASPAELLKIKGISNHTALYVAFLKHFSSLYYFLNAKEKDLISTTKYAGQYLISLLSGEKVEKVYVLILDSSNCLIKSVLLESGVVNKAAIIPRKVVESALENKASSIILSHNHPGGLLKPSASDIECTRLIKKALDTMEIAFHDHIIIAGNLYFSFRENKIMDGCEV